MTTLEEVAEIIAEQMHTDADKITAETNIKTDIQADSLDVAQILFALEDKYGIEIPTEKAMSQETVGQVVELIESLKA